MNLDAIAAPLPSAPDIGSLVINWMRAKNEKHQTTTPTSAPPTTNTVDDTPDDAGDDDIMPTTLDTTTLETSHDDFAVAFDAFEGLQLDNHNTISKKKEWREFMMVLKLVGTGSRRYVDDCWKYICEREGNGVSLDKEKAAGYYCQFKASSQSGSSDGRA